MMQRLWNDILDRFGRDVILRGQGSETTVQALVQPILERGTDQEAHGPLGLGRQDRFRYLGPAGCPVDLDTVVELDGQEYQVRSAHLEGEGICPYWWAMLYPREEAVV